MRKHATIMFTLSLAMFVGVVQTNAVELSQKSNFVPLDWYASSESTSTFKKKIDINLKNLWLEDVLKTIETKGGIRLTYDKAILPKKRVSLSKNRVSVIDAIQLTLANTGLTVMASPSGQVVIMGEKNDKEVVLNSIITGTVFDVQSGETIPGANVFLEGTSIGAPTNAEGVYSLTNVKPGDYEITARLIGYKKVTKNISVGSDEQITMNFELNPNTLTMDEVIVSGMVDPIDGKKIPFSVGKVSKQNITAVPTTGSALGAIQGKVAGVQIVRGSGQPGTGVNILLRTPTSITGSSNSPMYVVDGVVLGTSFTGTTVDLESLDIEDVEVIKGAAAASLYGSRAAGGVISITTSRGKGLKLDETRITYRGELGMTAAPTNLPLSNHHYYQTNAQGEFIDGSGNVTTDPTARVIADDRFMDNEYGVPLYDNVSTFFRPGSFQTHSLSVSQRLDKTNFMISANNYQEEGSLENNDGFYRNNFRVNLDHIVSDKFYISASAYHNRSKRDNLSGSPFWDLLMYPNTVDLGVKDENGDYLIQPDASVNAENPIWRQASRDNFTERARTLASIDLKYSPFDWLNASANISYDRSDILDQTYVPKGTPISVTSDSRSDGSLNRGISYTDALNGSFSLSGLQRFGKLNTRVTARAMFESENYNYIGAEGENFGLADLPDLSFARDQYTSSSSQDIRSTGYFIQAGLDYDNKYIADLLLRRDGSSLFGPDARWNNYYRIGLSYRLSMEDWWVFDDITEFKLRYSRGTAGGRPGFSYRYETWSYNASSGSVSKSTLGNKNLKPEITTEQEFGVDFILLDRYSFQLSYIKQLTEQQLLQRPQRAVTGYPSQWVNDGSQSGSTIEATIEAQIYNTRDMRWSATLIADHSISQIEEWNRPSFFDELQLIEAGASLGDMWGEYHYTSLDQLPENLQSFRDNFQVNDDGYVVAVGTGNSWEEGISKDLWGSNVTVDGKSYAWGNPIVATDEEGLPDLVKVGSSLPDFNVGLLNNFFYKGFTLHTQLHAQIGGNVYNGTRQRLYQYSRHGDMDQSGKSDATKKPFDYYYTLYNFNNVTQEFSEDGSFLKLREVALKYTLSQDVLSKIGLGNGVESISFGMIGRNLLTISNYSGFDPEVGSVLSRWDFFGYPVTRSFTGSIEIAF